MLYIYPYTTLIYRDTAGQQQFHQITKTYYKRAHGIICVYDISDQNSLNNINYWINNIKAHASNTVQIILIGNKSDLRNNTTPTNNNNSTCLKDPTTTPTASIKNTPTASIKNAPTASIKNTTTDLSVPNAADASSTPINHYLN